VTGSVALTLLGPDYQFRTAYAARGPVEGGVLRGDLVVIGRGDPTVSDRAQGSAMTWMSRSGTQLPMNEPRNTFSSATRAACAYR